MCILESWCIVYALIFHTQRVGPQVSCYILLPYLFCVYPLHSGDIFRCLIRRSDIPFSWFASTPATVSSWNYFVREFAYLWSWKIPFSALYALILTPCLCTISSNACLSLIIYLIMSVVWK